MQASQEQGLGTALLRTRLGHRAWRRLFGSRSWARRAGSFREKESHGLIPRPNYAYGMLRAADTARFFGKSAVTACEFGVATGMGLTNMSELGRLIEAETGVKFRIVGFDTGAGLPPPAGYKDHPELWSGGDFAMGDPDTLRRELDGRAELILGDIADTIGPFTQTLSADCPLGFVSIDVDIYSGTVAALKALHGPFDCYLPAISFYLDDVGSYFSNEACGELCAVAEHNAALPARPIYSDRSLPRLRGDAFSTWYRSMYVGHILDHPDRNRPRERGSLRLEEHLQYMAALR
jgi:hypothetical protein